MSRVYDLRCVFCNKSFVDDGIRLECDADHEASLLVTEYTATQFTIHTHETGIFRYQEWLPVERSLPGTERTITYQSERLNRLLGLPHLWIAFNGYWPEKHAWLHTTTFKELEASAVLARLPGNNTGVLTIASAGNTAASFASLCSLLEVPCLILLPWSGLARLQFIEPLNPCVKIVVLTGFVDYYDAIQLADRVAKHDSFVLEGGVKNVARRDGLGTVLLSAIEAIGQLPHYYFQAIGSGAGGIAVHGMARKLIQDGRFGRVFPRLMLSQNAPFAPIYHSWKAGQRAMIALDRAEGKRQLQQISAHVLSNQRPAYSISGGVFDVLRESRGAMLVADNVEVAQALALFEEAEGIDIDPAAGVALATLRKEVASGNVERDALILLNVTGGGWKRRNLGHHISAPQPALQISEKELALDQTIERIRSLFS